MSELVDASGRPAGQDDTRYRQPLSKGGFEFFIHTTDKEQLVAACLVPNDGHVAELPLGTPVWDYDPQMALIAYEVNAALEEIREDISGARDACDESVEEQIRELSQMVSELATDLTHTNAALDTQRKRCDDLEQRLQGSAQ